jgi:hypothetical protein
MNSCVEGTRPGPPAPPPPTHPPQGLGKISYTCSSSARHDLVGGTAPVWRPFQFGFPLAELDSVRIPQAFVSVKYRWPGPGAVEGLQSMLSLGRGGSRSMAMRMRVPRVKRTAKSMVDEKLLTKLQDHVVNRRFVCS